MIKEVELTDGASLVAQMVNSLPAMRETQDRSPGQENPLEKKMTTHSSTLAWEIPWTEKPGGLRPWGLQSWTQPRDKRAGRCRSLGSLKAFL